MSKPISRRSFLKKSLVIGAAAGVTLCGGTTLAATYRPKIEKPELTYGESSMQNRVLITYATKAGTSAGIATRMSELFANEGLSVDVLPVDKANDISAYSTVIVGSGIYIGKILPQAMDFITQNQAALQSKNFSLFIACMTLKDATDENRKMVSDYLIPVREVVKPQSEGLFAGMIDMKRLNLLEKIAIKAMNAPQGDFRNWTEIETWAKSIQIA